GAWPHAATTSSASLCRNFATDVQPEMATHLEVRLADSIGQKVAQPLLHRHARQARALGRDALRRDLEIVRDDEADAVRGEIRRRAPRRDQAVADASREALR